MRTATSNKSKGFTDEERAAMKKHAKELETKDSTKKDNTAGEVDVIEKIAWMQGTELEKTKVKR